MKKIYKILLIVLLVVLLVGAYYGYQVFQMVMGGEDVEGIQDKIPVIASALPEITKDSADWPQWRGQNYDGKSKTTGINTDWSKGLKKLWQVDYLCQEKGSVSWSSVAVQGNRLIVPGRDAKNDLVFCLNALDGKLIWMGKYEANTGTSHGAGARATPCISDGKVYTFGRGGHLVCWDFKDGKMIWSKNIIDIGGIEPSWGFSSSLLVYKNMVIAQGGGKAVAAAYDKNSGELIWKSMEGEVGYSAPALITIDGETKLLIYHGKGLACLEPETGKMLWNVPWETEYCVNATTPLVDNQIVFHTSGYNMGSQAIKADKGGYKVLWKNTDFAAQHSDPILINGFIYGYSGESTQNKGAFKCIELATGKEMWPTNEIGWGTSTFVDGYLICLDIKGNLFLVKPNSSKFEKMGELKGTFSTVSLPEWTIPVVANGKLYVRYLQTLVCYDLM